MSSRQCIPISPGHTTRRHRNPRFSRVRPATRTSPFILDQSQPHHWQSQLNNMNINITKPFIYTVLFFLALCLASYIASAQAADTRTVNLQLSAGPDRPASESNLSLVEALRLAMDRNRDIRIAGLDVARAGEDRKVARSISLPAAGVNGQVSHYFMLPPFFGFGGNNAGGNSGNGSGDKVPYGRFGGKDQFTATLWVTQSLYNPSARPSRIRAELTEKQSRSLLGDQQAIVAADVRRTYLQVLVLGERIRLQKESLGRNQKALADAKSLLAQGRALRVDTLRAFTSVKNLEPDLLRLSYAIEVGKLRLKTLVGIDSSREIVLSDSLGLPERTPIPPDAEVYAEAVKNRPDLQALALQPGIDEQQERLAAAARKPSVSLVGQYNVQTQAGRFDYFNSYYPSTPFAGATVSVPLFNGNANLARARAA